MSGLKQTVYGMVQGGVKVSPDEIDAFKQYIIMNPSVSATYFGTAAAGTSTQANALVVLNARADYPRNALGAVAGSADMGGSWVINAKDQFGNPFTETITIGTATNGGTTAGTKVIAQLISGTFTFTTGAVGSGTPTLGVAIGTASNSPIFGLWDRLGATTDVKAVTWLDADVAKMTNASSHADVANSAVRLEIAGGVAAADSFVVVYQPTKDLSSEGKQNNL